MNYIFLPMELRVIVSAVMVDMSKGLWDDASIVSSRHRQRSHHKATHEGVFCGCWWLRYERYHQRGLMRESGPRVMPSVRRRRDGRCREGEEGQQQLGGDLAGRSARRTRLLPPQ